MEITSGEGEDLARNKPEPGSYEWWYFDGLDAGGETGFVIIFYEGNPFSERYADRLTGRSEGPAGAGNFPALSISVYDKGRPVYYGFQEVHPDDAQFGGDSVRGHVKGSTYEGERRGDELHYRLCLDQRLPGGDAVHGELNFRSSLSPELIPGMEGEKGRLTEKMHRWGLVQPAAKVTGQLRISGYDPMEIDFSGSGYHDHNMGREPMEKSFDEWYWGRIHFTERTLVYYLMKQNSLWDRRAWLIGSTGRVEPFEGEIAMEDLSSNLFGLRTARRIKFQGDGTSAYIQHDRVLDNGPFYQRFRSRAQLLSNDRFGDAYGIGEYIRPDRIASRMFRPLVSMRIDYPDRPDHWVQRRPGLYRWTW